MAPLRKVVISEKHPISNHTLRSLENRRQTLYKRMKKTRSDKSIQDYKKIKKKIKSTIKSIKQDVITKMLKNWNYKNLWHGVNTICGRKTSQTESLALINPVNGVSTSDNNECASIFADAFKNKVTKLVEKVGQSEVMTDYISRKFEERTISTQFNTNEIVEVVMSLKQSTSTGPDDISINYIKDAVVKLSPVLKFIFDKATSLAITPTQWKRAKIIAIQKRGKGWSRKLLTCLSSLLIRKSFWKMCAENYVR